MFPVGTSSAVTPPIFTTLLAPDVFGLITICSFVLVIVSPLIVKYCIVALLSVNELLLLTVSCSAYKLVSNVPISESMFPTNQGAVTLAENTPYPPSTLPLMLALTLPPLIFASVTVPIPKSPIYLPPLM